MTGHAGDSSSVVDASRLQQAQRVIGATQQAQDNSVLCIAVQLTVCCGDPCFWCLCVGRCRHHLAGPPDRQEGAGGVFLQHAEQPEADRLHLHAGLHERRQRQQHPREQEDGGAERKHTAWSSTGKDGRCGLEGKIVLCARAIGLLRKNVFNPLGTEVVNAEYSLD